MQLRIYGVIAIGGAAYFANLARMYFIHQDVFFFIIVTYFEEYRSLQTEMSSIFTLTTIIRKIDLFTTVQMEHRI